ncbi:MAG: alpha/beta fold hydrolase [Hyphomonas sp.]|uniref:alpha/beta fold hydrolase n=1 Tax=Hyphomonas sp. TaxID=87 RepID=UPI003263CD16
MTHVFGEYALDPDTIELRRGANIVAIEPQVFALIQYLIEHRERVISRDELIEAVWGGRFVSDSAISSRAKSARKALGDDGRTQAVIKTVHGKGVRFVAPVEAAEPGAAGPALRVQGVQQDIRFCRSADGTQIAYATAGEGRPLVKTANWLNHLEFDWKSPVWTHIFGDLMQGQQLVRYDARGNGLSDWDVSDFSVDRQVEDLEAVIDATGLTRFPLLGLSQGCAVSVAYAARHPEKVTKLVLVGGYARGWRHGGHKMVAETDALITLIRTGWGRNNPVFRQIFTGLFMPTAPAENQAAFNELQRITASPQSAAALLDALGDVDVRDDLGAVQAPTLVIHARRDMRVPMGGGRELASGIKGARFMTLETDNHVIPSTDPAWAVCYAAIRNFLME